MIVVSVLVFSWFHISGITLENINDVIFFYWKKCRIVNENYTHYFENCFFIQNEQTRYKNHPNKPSISHTTIRKKTTQIERQLLPPTYRKLSTHSTVQHRYSSTSFTLDALEFFLPKPHPHLNHSTTCVSRRRKWSIQQNGFPSITDVPSRWTFGTKLFFIRSVNFFDRGRDPRSV